MGDLTSSRPSRSYHGSVDFLKQLEVYDHVARGGNVDMAAVLFLLRPWFSVAVCMWSIERKR